MNQACRTSSADFVKQAGIIDVSNGKRDQDEFDALGAAGPVPGAGRRGAGGPVRGVATNLDDMGF